MLSLFLLPRTCALLSYLFVIIDFLNYYFEHIVFIFFVILRFSIILLSLFHLFVPINFIFYSFRMYIFVLKFFLFGF